MAKQKAVPAGKQRVIVETGIYQKSNGKYLAQFRDRGRKQNWKEFKTLAEARRWRAIRDRSIGLPPGAAPWQGSRELSERCIDPPRGSKVLTRHRLATRRARVAAAAMLTAVDTGLVASRPD